MRLIAEVLPRPVLTDTYCHATNLFPFLRRLLVAYTVPSWFMLAAECAEGADAVVAPAAPAAPAAAVAVPSAPRVPTGAPPEDPSPTTTPEGSVG